MNFNSNQNKFIEKKRKRNYDYNNHYRENKQSFQKNQYNDYRSPRKKFDFKKNKPNNNFDFIKNKNKYIAKLYIFQKLLSMNLIERKNNKYENNRIIPCLPFN